MAARTTTTIARHGRLRRRGSAGSILSGLAITLSVVLVATLGVGGFTFARLAGNLGSGVALAHIDGGKPADLGAVKGGFNMLIVGSDTRSGQGSQFAGDIASSSGAGNNDVTIMVHVAQDHKSVTVVSFPRDSMVPIPACPNGSGGQFAASSKAMLNTALSRGGLACPVLMIEKLTGVSIAYAAEITFDGVIAMSDAVGGVTVCVARGIDDPLSGAFFKAGQQTLVGANALAFLRTRHGVGDGSDLGRISNQQVFLSALVRKVHSNNVLGNLGQLYNLANAATKNMTLSQSLTNPVAVVQLALALKSVPPTAVNFVQYPTVSDPDNPNRVIPQAAAAAVLNHALVNDLPIEITGGLGRASEAAATPTPTPSPSGSASPTPSATPSTVVTLPPTITGQAADEQTCSKGQG